ncbi:MAG: tetratricopeptide repeat-containing protein [Planctomycetia bacterium]
MKIPTYLDALQEAAALRRTDPSPENLEAARTILETAFQVYPHALPLGDELVLVLEKMGRDSDAAQLLNELARRFGDKGEETLCRLAKLYKKRAGWPPAAGGEAAAYNALKESEALYARAYEKSYHFYPRINELSVRFLRAAVSKMLLKSTAAANVDDPAALLDDVAAKADELRNDPAAWKPRLDDDHVWIPATRGELLILLDRWEEAAAAYLEALAKAGGSKFYYKCMKDQAAKLMQAAVVLGRRPVGGLADPEAFFRCDS